MRYKQLDFRKRCQIYGLWKAGYNQTKIAKEVDMHKSTISRELKRNITFVRTALGSWQYKPNYAQGYTDERHKMKPKHIKFTKARTAELVTLSTISSLKPFSSSVKAMVHILLME